MRYGFAIDQRVCIGCHACTVACKAEHLVPIGVNRTWVKYIEKGEFPDVRRHFQVSRCNHCADAPCVSICPTNALFDRKDGIVDFDNQRCIGCKSCTQACPYDAIYIDPSTNTAAKCNFCAHRIEQDLNPSCVNVCPEQAIRYGDLDDPNSDISQLIANNDARVRKPEAGTDPKLYYINGEQSSLDASATATSETAIWGSQTRGVGHNAGVSGETFDLLGIVRKAQATHQSNVGEKSDALDGLLRELEMATGPNKVRRAYDQPDKGIMWGWEVAAYILTKAISAGLGLVAALFFILPSLGVSPVVLGGVSASDQTWLALTALAFLGLTGGLLIKDLDRPDRFLYVLLRPHWSSWLVRGGYIITAYGGLLTLWLLNSTLFHSHGLSKALAWPLGIVALMAAVYTAFLFRQCKGRDFWQSPLLAPHMLVHAPLAGFALLALLGYWSPVILGVSLVVHGAIVLIEVLGHHKSEDASQTAKSMRQGKAGQYFWYGVVGLGHALPLLLLGLDVKAFAPLVGLVILIGMGITEYLWVYLPQRRPNV